MRIDSWYDCDAWVAQHPKSPSYLLSCDEAGLQSGLVDLLELDPSGGGSLTCVIKLDYRDRGQLACYEWSAPLDFAEF